MSEMGYHQCLHACQCPTIINNPGDAVGFCLVVLINDMVSSNWATPEIIPLRQCNLRMELGQVAFAFSPPRAWIKDCDSCLQILAGLEMIFIWVIFSLHELSFCDKWILCRPWQGYTPQLTTNPDLMTDHPGIFRQLCSLNSNWEPSFEGELGQVI